MNSVLYICRKVVSKSGEKILVNAPMFPTTDGVLIQGTDANGKLHDIKFKQISRIEYSICIFNTSGECVVEDFYHDFKFITPFGFNNHSGYYYVDAAWMLYPVRDVFKKYPFRDNSKLIQFTH